MTILKIEKGTPEAEKVITYLKGRIANIIKSQKNNVMTLEGQEEIRMMIMGRDR